MTNSSKLRRIKMCIEASKRHHANAIDASDDALDGDIKPKDALASIRTALSASGGHLDSAHSLLLQMLRQRADDDATRTKSCRCRRPCASRASTASNGIVRKVTPRAGPPAPVASGGGAHTTNHCNAKEVARLRSLWQ